MISLFGTDGIRGLVGTHPFTLQDLPNLGAAIGKWIQEKYGQNALVILSYDTRISCHWIKSALQAGLLLYALEIIDIGIMPTPALSHFMQQNNNYSCGIMISASHNLYQDNGIKIIESSGKISASDELLISTYYHQKSIVDSSDFGTICYSTTAQEEYCTLIAQHFKPHFLDGKKIVLDVAFGATYQVAPILFNHFGAEVILLHDTPNGYNINQNCGALHPKLLQEAVMQHKATIGFAFDGDGDRVIAVNAQGDIKNGDDILALLSSHAHYNTSDIVGTLMSNQGFEVYLNNKGKKLLRTAVGDKYVADGLKQHRLLLGGEQSGHIILGDIVNTGDGILVALKLLQTIITQNNWNLETFTAYPQVLVNVPIKIKTDLLQEPYANFIRQSEKKLSSGRIVVRYSGTELLLRVMVEDETLEQAENIAYELANLLQKFLT